MKLSRLLLVKLAVSSLYDDMICEKCGEIQGKEFKGVKKSYCEHITKEVDDMLKPISEKLTMEAINSSGFTRKVKNATGKKNPYNVSLDNGVVKETKKLLKEYNLHFSGHIEQLLDQWCQDQKESEVFEKIMQEALESLRSKEISNKELTAIEVLNNEDMKEETLSDRTKEALSKDGFT